MAINKYKLLPLHYSTIRPLCQNWVLVFKLGLSEVYYYIKVLTSHAHIVCYVPNTACVTSGIRIGPLHSQSVDSLAKDSKVNVTFACRIGRLKGSKWGKTSFVYRFSTGREAKEHQAAEIVGNRRYAQPTMCHILAVGCKMII